MDDPKHESRAQSFLQKQGAGLTKRRLDSVAKEGRTTNHYLYTGGSQAPLVDALDRDWPGPLPHTVLVAPGGQIVWRHTGIIDRAETIRKIVDVLGSYYQPTVDNKKTE